MGARMKYIDTVTVESVEKKGKKDQRRALGRSLEALQPGDMAVVAAAAVALVTCLPWPTKLK